MLTDDDKKALLLKGQNSKKKYWKVRITGDCNDADYSHKIIEYDTDDSFIQEGLPLSLMFFKLIGRHKLEECDWIYSVFMDFECIPCDQYSMAHSIDEVEVDGPKGKFDLNSITEEQTEEIIRNFLKDEDIFYDVDDDMIEKFFDIVNADSKKRK